MKVNGAVALLYEIASHDLHGTKSPESMNAGERESCIRKVARSLLADWNPPNVDKPQPAWEYVEQWSGERLRGERLWEVEQLVTQRKRIFAFFDHNLLNPLRLKETDAGKKEYPGAPIRGMLHCDLHLRNILVPERKSSGAFWLIDFAQSREGFLLYDHAYLEVSLLLSEPERFEDGHRLYEVLVALEEDCHSNPAVYPDDLCLFNCIRGLRSEVKRWTKESERSSLEGAVEAQFLLARVSAGLNWANKPLRLSDQKAAFVYAAWAAHEFMKKYTRDVWWSFFEAASLCPSDLP